MIMSNSSIENLLKERLRPIECQRDFARDFLFRPLHLSAYLMFGLGMATGIFRRDLVGIPALFDSAYYSARMLTCIAVIYLIFPYSLRFCAVKRIPCVCHTVTLFAIVIGIHMLLFRSLTTQFTDTSLTKRYLYHMFMIVPLVVPYSAFTARAASKSLFDHPEIYHSWRRYQPPKLGLYEKLDRENVSPIRYLEAQTPYVLVVTKTSRETLRMSFREAKEMVTPNLGWQIHRSVWVAKDEVKAVRFVNGNPRVYLKDGTELNASRAVVPEIKAYLHERELEEAYGSAS